MVRDWILGECAASGRQRAALVAGMENILRWGGMPVLFGRFLRKGSARPAIPR